MPIFFAILEHALHCVGKSAHENCVWPPLRPFKMMKEGVFYFVIPSLVLDIFKFDDVTNYTMVVRNPKNENISNTVGVIIFKLGAMQ